MGLLPKSIQHQDSCEPYESHILNTVAGSCESGETHNKKVEHHKVHVSLVAHILNG
jgi:hypothetical protein